MKWQGHAIRFAEVLTPAQVAFVLTNQHTLRVRDFQSYPLQAWGTISSHSTALPEIEDTGIGFNCSPAWPIEHKRGRRAAVTGGRRTVLLHLQIPVHLVHLQPVQACSKRKKTYSPTLP